MTHIVSVIATHQARIRCLLSHFLPEKKIERFQNGSVIKISVNRDNISIKLVYSGELDENKADRKYYVTDDYVKKDEDLFQPIPFPKELELISNNNYIPIETSNTFHFYLIRHGQGTHNILKGMKKKIKFYQWRERHSFN